MKCNFLLGCFISVDWYNYFALFLQLVFCEFSNFSVTAFRLDGKHTVFGQVVGGMEIVKEMEGQGTQSGDAKTEIVIEDCGAVN